MVYDWVKNDFRTSQKTEGHKIARCRLVGIEVANL